jgi:hypothetical protein
MSDTEHKIPRIIMTTIVSYTYRLHVLGKQASRYDGVEFSVRHGKRFATGDGDLRLLFPTPRLVEPWYTLSRQVMSGDIKESQISKFRSPLPTGPDAPTENPSLKLYTPGGAMEQVHDKGHCPQQGVVAECPTWSRRILSASTTRILRPRSHNHLTMILTHHTVLH